MFRNIRSRSFGLAAALAFAVTAHAPHAETAPPARDDAPKKVALADLVGNDGPAPAPAAPTPGARSVLFHDNRAGAPDPGTWVLMVAGVAVVAFLAVGRR